MTAAQEGQEIHWHLDPTVWYVTEHGGYSASIWWTGPGTRLGWIIHPAGENELDPVALGAGDGEADAKAQAEYLLRKLAAVKLTPAQLTALTRLADPMHTTEDTLWCGNGVRITTAQALARLGLAVFREGSTYRDWGIRLARPGQENSGQETGT